MAEIIHQFNGLKMQRSRPFVSCQNKCGEARPLNEPPHDKTNKMACAPSEDSDQPGHPPSLIRVFAVRMKKACVLSYALSAQRRLWSPGWSVFAGRTFIFFLVLSWGGSNVSNDMWQFDSLIIHSVDIACPFLYSRSKYIHTHIYQNWVYCLKLL